MKFKNTILITLGILFVGILTGCGTSAESQEFRDQDKLRMGTVKDDIPKSKLLSSLDKIDKKVREEKKNNSHQENKEDLLKVEEPVEEVTTKEEDSNHKESSKETKGNSSTTTKSNSKSEKNKKEISNEPNVSKASGTYYVTAPSLNVRLGDSTNYRLLGSIAKDNAVAVTGKTSNGWYQFEYNNKKGYVSGNYLTTTKPSEPKVENKDTTKPEATESEQSNDGNVVDKMTNIGNSQQVILVTTKESSTSTGEVRTYEIDGNGKWNEVLNATAYIGKNGFTSNKVEGDGKSPTGKYSIGTAFGYEGNPGTKLNFKNSTAHDVWVDDSDSKFYNTWQEDNKEDKDWNSAENMTHRLYNYGFVINYNTAQTPGKGSAIFMHVGNSYTLGCTAMSQSNLIRIMKWVDPAKNPVVIQTPESDLGNY